MKKSVKTVISFVLITLLALSFSSCSVFQSMRENALNAAVRLQTRLRREREHKIEISRLENGCNITMSVLDGNDELMTVTLFVADYEQALSVKEKFLSDPVKVYSNIVALLMA